MLRFRPALALTPRLAIATFFVLKGFVLGNWIPRIPGIVERLDIARGELGVIMFLGALGCLLSFGFAAKAIRRFGSASSGLVFAATYLALFPAVVLAPNPLLFAAGMMLLGFTNGGYDVAIGVQGGVVERRSHKPLFSALYGYFSLGALAGSLCGGLAAQFRVPMLLQFGAIALIGVPLLLWLRRSLLADEPRVATPTRARRRFALTLPPRAIWPLGAMIFCIAIGEDSVANWSALYLRQDLGMSAGIGALAYTFFSVTTLVGRLVGDTIINRFGVVRVLRIGSALAAAGIGGGVLVNQPWSILLGYAIVGAGISIVVPVTYRAAGSVPGIAPGDAVAAVASLGYMGFLLGPPMIGAISDLLSLRIALGLVAVVLLGIQMLVASFPVSRPTGEALPRTIDTPALGTERPAA
jgi:MFS family permease